MAKKTTHGGARPGSGRKPLPEGEAMAPYSLKLRADQRAKLQLLGGAEWMRRQIDRAKLSAS